MPMGDLFIEVEVGKGEITNYRRVLDISNSIGKVTYSKDDINFERI
ncbi:MAG: hypothetical protein GY808_12260 [Gammaproteobacteria bacterium]|nr:hypothetical protein [Gammaproteobacteria bacterium]